LADTKEPAAGAGTAEAWVAGPEKQDQKSSPRKFVREASVTMAVAIVLAVLIKTFLLQAFYIPSESMEPTLRIGDRVLVNRVVYRFHPPRRGDVIVFSDPNPPPVHRSALSAFRHWLTQGFGVSTNPEKDFIKRVIALPGETVEVRDGRVYIDGKPLKPEPYLSPLKETRSWGPHRVGPNSLFVMGDNRTMSGDSRYGLGDIPYDKVIGRAFVIIWPPGHWRWLAGLHYALGLAVPLPPLLPVLPPGLTVVPLVPAAAVRSHRRRA
jgi:signal peptidase I